MEILSGIDVITFPIDENTTGGVFLLRGESPTLVDTGIDSTPEQYLFPFLETIGLSTSALRRIVLTHSHYDHVGGLPAIFARADLPVLLHKETGEDLEAPWKQVQRVRELYPQDNPYLDTADPEEPFVLPTPLRVDRVVQGGESLLAGSRVWQILYTPGHIPGMISLYNPEDRVLISSDSFQAAGTNQGEAIYTDVRAYLNSLDRVQPLEIDHLLLSHPFKPFGKIHLAGGEIRQFFEVCRQRCRDYEQTLLGLLRQEGKPVSLHCANTLFRQRYRCDSARYLTAMTVKAHLDDLMARGELQRQAGPENGFPLWMV